MTHQVIKLLAEILGRNEADLNEDMFLLKDLNIESVELLEIAFELEDRFGKTFTDHTLWKLPNYLLAHNLFKDANFTIEGIQLIQSEIPSLSLAEIEQMKSPHDLLQKIKIKDVIHFLQKE